MLPLTFQQPSVEGHNLDDLHPVIWQDDPKAQQQEGNVFINTSTNNVESWDYSHDQQQGRLKQSDITYCIRCLVSTKIIGFIINC